MHTLHGAQDDDATAGDVYEVDAIISMTVHEEATRGTEGTHFFSFPMQAHCAPIQRILQSFLAKCSVNMPLPS